MEDTKLFNEVFDDLASRYHRLSKRGTLVYYDGECVFNTDGYNLAYNLYRLTKTLNDNGEFI